MDLIAQISRMKCTVRIVKDGYDRRYKIKTLNRKLKYHLHNNHCLMDVALMKNAWRDFLVPDTQALCNIIEKLLKVKIKTQSEKCLIS